MPRDVSMETVQGYFGMVDVNKQLITKAFTEEQLERALNFQKHLNNVLKDLYVPNSPNYHIKAHYSI